MGSVNFFYFTTILIVLGDISLYLYKFLFLICIVMCVVAVVYAREEE